MHHHQANGVLAKATLCDQPSAEVAAVLPVRDLSDEIQELQRGELGVGLATLLAGYFLEVAWFFQAMDKGTSDMAGFDHMSRRIQVILITKIIDIIEIIHCSFNTEAQSVTIKDRLPKG
ncbi:hypothetical protein FN846DRAFT_888469 [Sphaerosporella brunnea]|uniref:Uncharacterized protein n=1 Tax=Sphaerosporella brunnea TaxID=1250544 RepID=A0A5J5F379_9PEZI|nr:hypothetical protein FN846DRAFT_888469 [Sphaerosporella brunnea]